MPRTIVSAPELPAQPLPLPGTLVLRAVAVALLPLFRERDAGGRPGRRRGASALRSLLLPLPRFLHAAADRALAPSRRIVAATAHRARAARRATTAPVRKATRGLKRFQRRPKTTDAGRAAIPIAAWKIPYARPRKFSGTRSATSARSAPSVKP